MPTPSCRDALSREIYNPVTDPLTGICYRNPCAAEEAGVVDWIPGCVLAEPFYPTTEGPVLDSWASEVWWSGGRSSGGRRRRRPRWTGGDSPGGGRFGAKLPDPRLRDAGPRTTVGGGGNEKAPPASRLGSGQRIGSGSVNRSRGGFSVAPSYAAIPTIKASTTLSVRPGHAAAPTAAATQRSTYSVSAPRAAVRSLKGLGGDEPVGDTLRRLEAQPFVVQCDNWSQIPGVHGRRVIGVTAAMREAKSVLAVGNNVRDTCRIYLPTNGWLTPGSEVVAVSRRAIGGHKVVFNRGLKALGQTTTHPLATAVASVAQSWARIFVIATFLGTVPPAIVGGVVGWKTKSWWKALAAAGATVAVELAAAGAIRERRVASAAPSSTSSTSPVAMAYIR